jgi:hypothetical protein
VIVYSPGSTLRTNRPSRPDVVLARACPFVSCASTGADTGFGGHGCPIRSTGQVGPAITTPRISDIVVPDRVVRELPLLGAELDPHAASKRAPMHESSALFITDVLTMAHASSVPTEAIADRRMCA